MLSDCTTAIASSAPVYYDQFNPIHAIVALLSVRSMRDPLAARLLLSTIESSPIAYTSVRSLRRGMTLSTAHS